MADTLGPYQIIERLGSGGMGSVYRARDSRTGDLIALKVLHEHRATDADYLRRFQQEARLAQRLQHPNIVRTFDSGVIDGTYFLAMEIVEGETLYDRLSRPPRPDVAEVRRIAVAIATALEQAHKHRVIHRDIKPGNVLLDRDGSIKVSDFGVARALDATTKTRTGTFLGSVTYAAPEALAGDADARSDLYSLGIVLYEAMMGRVPFDADTPIAVMRMHENTEPPDIDKLLDIDRQLGSIVHRLLVKDPDDRYQSAAHLLRALRDYQTAIADAPQRTSGRRQRRRAGRIALFAAAFAVVMGATLGGFAMWRVLDEEGDAAIAEETPFIVAPVIRTATAAVPASAAFATRNARTNTTNTAVALRTQLAELPDALKTIAAELTATAITSTATVTVTATPEVSASFDHGDPSPALGSAIQPDAEVDVTVTYRGQAEGSEAALEIFVSSELLGDAVRSGGSSPSVAAGGDGSVTLTAEYDAYQIPVTLCGVRVTVGDLSESRGCAP